jgi:hypothetical protein
VDLAGDADIYAGSWMGPASQYDFPNQTAAIDVLLGGLAVANTTDSATGSTPLASMSPGPPTPTHHKGTVGAIVGGAVGGTIVLLLILVLLVLIRRQRRRIAVAAAFPNPFEVPSQDSIQPAHRRDNQQKCQDKDPIPPPSSSTNLVPQNDSARDQTLPPNQDHDAVQGITIGSLIWELNELLRRNNRTVGEESLPVYTAPHLET